MTAPRSLGIKLMKIKEIKALLKKLGTFIRRLFCVPKCASCGKRLPVFIDADSLNHGIPCFCKPCLSSFCREKTAMCHNCGRIASECVCIPRGCNLMQETVPSLFFYHPDTNGVTSKVIFTLKHKKHADLYEFITEELSEKILILLKESDISPSSCIFTHIPRSHENLKRNGFDQSLRLSRLICKKLGGAAALSLISRGGGKEQKKLSNRQRKENANKSFFINPSIYKVRGAKSGKNPIGGKTVVLIDDVMTSGASASRCLKLLRSAGASTVLFVSVARCEVKKIKRKMCARTVTD